MGRSPVLYNLMSSSACRDLPHCQLLTSDIARRQTDAPTSCTWSKSRPLGYLRIPLLKGVKLLQPFTRTRYQYVIGGQMCSFLCPFANQNLIGTEELPDNFAHPRSALHSKPSTCINASLSRLLPSSYFYIRLLIKHSSLR